MLLCSETYSYVSASLLLSCYVEETNCWHKLELDSDIYCLQVVKSVVASTRTFIT